MLPVAVLRHRAFRNLFIGQSISQFGDALYYVVFMFMVGKITGSPAMVGAVGVAETLPFLFGAYSGVLADRIDRKLLMLWSDWFCMGVLLAFSGLVFLTGTPPLWTLFAVPFLLSTLRTFFYPAKDAAIPNLVPAEDTLEANTLNRMSFNLFYVMGLLISTFVMSGLYALSPGLFFGLTVLINAITFGFSAMFIRTLPSIVPDRKDEEKHPWIEFKQGLQYILHRRVLKVLMVAGLFMSLMISPFFVAYVAANNEWFGGKPWTLSLCEMSFFVGMILGSAAMGKLKVGRVGLGYAWGLGIVGIGVALMAFSPVLWLFMICNFISGLALPFADLPMMTYIMVKVEDTFRGRVNSTLMMLRVGIMPLGNALGGLGISAIGLVWMFLIMGLGMTAVAFLSILDPEFRKASLDDPKAVVEVEGDATCLSEAVA